MASGGKRLNGIIYMHRISDPRVGGISRKNLRMFRKLCGDDNLRNVLIVTTYWDRVGEEGNDREAALRNGAFKDLINAGAQLVRHDNGTVSARSIISALTHKEPVTMQIQNELQDGRGLAATSTGEVLTQEMQELMIKHAREMKDLRNQMEEAAQVNDEVLRAELDEERRILGEKIQRMTKDRQRLEVSFFEAQSKRMEEQELMERYVAESEQRRKSAEAKAAELHEETMKLREHMAKAEKDRIKVDEEIERKRRGI